MKTLQKEMRMTRERGKERLGAAGESEMRSGGDSESKKEGECGWRRVLWEWLSTLSV